MSIASELYEVFMAGEDASVFACIGPLGTMDKKYRGKDKGTAAIYAKARVMASATTIFSALHPLNDEERNEIIKSLTDCLNNKDPRIINDWYDAEKAK